MLKGTIPLKYFQNLQSVTVYQITISSENNVMSLMKSPI